MGGRSSSSGLASTQPQAQSLQQILQQAQQAGNQILTMLMQQAIQGQQQQPDVQPPPPQNTAPDTLAQGFQQLIGATDSQLAQIAQQARQTDLPNILNDVDDITQRFVYAAGINDKPAVLDDADFDKFLRDNNIPRSRVMARSVDDITYTNADGTRVRLSAQQQADLLKYSRLTYVGGKHGGMRSGAGAYFAQNGGVQTGYGSRTMVAAINPKSARIITRDKLIRDMHAFAQSHPQFARQVGAPNTNFSRNNMGVYALAMGYNVVHDTSQGYFNVIDRSALVFRKNDI